MRRFFLGLAITGIATLMPAWASAGDQEVAQEIAANLRNSGQMQGYSIGVKVSDGTAWLGGTVRSQNQLASALEIARSTVGVDKVVNELTIESSNVAQPTRQSPRPAVQQAAGAPAGRAQLTNAQEFEIDVPQLAPTPAAPRPLAAAPAHGAYQQPRPIGAPMPAAHHGGAVPAYHGAPMPMHAQGAPMGHAAQVRYDNPQMPGYAWPSYASHPNYAAVTYPKQYSASAFPFIGPFYPYPQVPLGWRKVTLEWDDGWWMLDFKD